MILEAAFLQVAPHQASDFEAAFRQAAPLIASIPGYLSHELQRCIETPGKYLLLVQQQQLEDHTVGFRASVAYQEWKRLLHHFYASFPTVEHFTAVELTPH